MSYLFNTYLYKPLLNGLIFLYDYASFGDFGLAIILLTLIIRFLLYPLFYKSFKNQTLMQKIQPEIERIQRDSKDDKERQARELMNLYKEHKINPFSSLLLLFVQLPVLIALYQVFLNGFTGDLSSVLYSFIPNPGTINQVFLGLIDLSGKSMIIVSLAALVQYYQGALSLPKKAGEESPNQSIGRKMVYIGPILTVVILSNLPAAVGLYWLASSLFSVGQQMIINKKIHG